MKRILLALLSCTFVSQYASAAEQNYILDENNVVRRNIKREQAVVPHRPLDGLGQGFADLVYMTAGTTVGVPVGLAASLVCDCSLESGLIGVICGAAGGMLTGLLTSACVKSLIDPLMTTYNRYAFKKEIMQAVAHQDVIELQKAISQAIDYVIPNLWRYRYHTTESLRSALQDEKALLDTMLEARLAADQIEDYTVRTAIMQSIEHGQITYCNRCNKYDGAEAHPLFYTVVVAARMLRGKPCLLPSYVYKNGQVINRLYCD